MKRLKRICGVLLALSLFVGCQGIDRADICRWIMVSPRTGAVTFDDEHSVGFLANNGYWSLEVQRSLTQERTYKIHLADYYSQSFDVVLDDLREEMTESFYPGATRKGLYKAVRIEDDVRFRRLSFSHTQHTFQDEASLLNFVKAPWYGKRERKMLTPDGILICVNTEYTVEDYLVTVEIVQLNLPGHPNLASLLQPHCAGLLYWKEASDGTTFGMELERLVK
jgi:hypothetical protein